MSKAIETKFLPASNRRGSRIKAHDGDKNSILADFQYAWNPDKNHAYAAFCLVKKMGWHGFYVGGSTKTGEVFVKVAADGRFPQAAGMAGSPKLRGWRIMPELRTISLMGSSAKTGFMSRTQGRARMARGNSARWKLHGSAENERLDFLDCYGNRQRGRAADASNLAWQTVTEATRAEDIDPAMISATDILRAGIMFLEWDGES